MQIGLLGDLGAQRIDDGEPTAAALRLPDAAYEMHIRHGRVVAPDEVELGIFGEIGRAARHRAIGAGPGLAAHSAAQSAPIKLARPEPVEEAQRHAVAGEQTVRPGIVQRQDRLRPPAPDNLVDPLVDLVERSLPGDALELPGAFRSGAAQRIQKPLRPVHKGLHVARHLCADDPGRIGQRVRPADLGDTAVIDRDGDAARIGAIEGADAGALFERHPKTPCGQVTRRRFYPGNAAARQIHAICSGCTSCAGLQPIGVARQTARRPGIRRTARCRGLGRGQ